MLSMRGVLCDQSEGVAEDRPAIFVERDFCRKAAGLLSGNAF